MFSVDVSIKGTAPILMNRHPLPEETEETQTKVSGRAKKYDWREEFIRSKYLMPLTGGLLDTFSVDPTLEDNKENMALYTPSEVIHGCMMKSALNFLIPGRGKKTYKDLVRAVVIIEPDYLIHEIQESEPDRRWVRIKTAAVVRTRAKLPDWSLSFRLVVNSDQLPVEALKQILEYGSQVIGIHDYRPKFGRFMVTKFEEVKTEEPS